MNASLHDLYDQRDRSGGSPVDAALAQRGQRLADEAKRKNNAERAQGGTKGIYESRSVASGYDKPEPVVLCGTEDDGWWFYLPESWPNPRWRGDIRWFDMARGTFVPDGQK